MHSFQKYAFQELDWDELDNLPHDTKGRRVQDLVALVQAEPDDLQFGSSDHRCDTSEDVHCVDVLDVVAYASKHIVTRHRAELVDTHTHLSHVPVQVAGEIRISLS